MTSTTPMISTLWERNKNTNRPKTSLTVCGHPLTVVSSFKYLQRIISDSDDNWTEVVSSICKARKKWAQLSRVMVREGEDNWTLDNFYLVVVQVVLIFGLEM